MIINTVSKNGGIYLVNGATPVQANQRDARYFEILEWLDSGGVLTPTYNLTTLKSLKKAEIKKDWDAAGLTNTATSSLGFEIDADRVAKDNITSLIDLGVEPITFRASDNSFHSVTLAELGIMKVEVIYSAFALYQKKWTLEAQIDAATTEEELTLINW